MNDRLPILIEYIDFQGKLVYHYSKACSTEELIGECRALATKYSCGVTYTIMQVIETQTFEPNE